MTGRSESYVLATRVNKAASVTLPKLKQPPESPCSGGLFDRQPSG